MMSGPRLAKSYVSNYLSKDLPARILTYRNHWNLSDSQLPVARKVITHEPFTLGHWPTIINMVMNQYEVKMYVTISPSCTQPFEEILDPVFRHERSFIRKVTEVEVNAIKKCYSNP